MTLVIAFFTSIFTEFVKPWLKNKFGNKGIYIFLFVVAGIGTFIYQYLYQIAYWQEIITKALEALAYAIALYEVLLKKLDLSSFFSSNSEE